MEAGERKLEAATADVLPGLVPSEPSEPSKKSEDETRWIKLIWDTYLATWPRKATLTKKREAVMLARLREKGAKLEEILLAVQNSKNDDWEKREKYSDLETLLKSKEQVERLSRMTAPTRPSKTELLGPSWDQDDPYAV